MIKTLRIHCCDYCQRDFSSFTRKEYLENVIIVRIPHTNHVCEFCSLPCYTNYFLKFYRRHKK